MKYRIDLSKEELLAFDRFCTYFPKDELEQRCPEVLKDKNFITLLGKLYQHINKFKGMTKDEERRLKKKAKKMLGIG